MSITRDKLPTNESAPKLLPEKRGWGRRETDGRVWWVRMRKPKAPVDPALLRYWAKGCLDDYVAELLRAAARTIERKR